MRTRTVALLALTLALGPVAGCAHGTTSDPQVASAGNGTAGSDTGSGSAGSDAGSGSAGSDAASGSAGSNSRPSPSASASDDPEAPLKFSRCMREHGITWFPDPVDGRMQVRVPKGQDRAKMEAAQEACKQWAPDGGAAHQATPEELQAAREMAKCMRENGVPNFPDPGPDGGIAIDGSKLGTGPGDPTFDKAEKACAKYLPKGTERRTEQGATA
jgi:hypothetical protein